MSNKTDFLMFSLMKKELKIFVELENLQNDPNMSQMMTKAEIPMKNLTSYKRLIDLSKKELETAILCANGEDGKSISEIDIYFVCFGK